jgi:peptidoglycan/LPS O-acetylase OafA/YrhL
MRASNGSFLYIRLLAAVAVLHSHSYAIVSGDRDSQPIVPILDVTVGTFAVQIFFAISGYLICGSALKGKFFEFLIARCLRIYPALIAVIFSTYLIIGPLASDLKIADYFSNSASWKYVLKNCSMILGARFDLPGVFVSNPLTAMVNGSLWTLPYELRMYLLFSVMCLAVSVFKIRSVKSAFGIIILILICSNVFLYNDLLPKGKSIEVVELVPSDLFYIFVFGSMTRLVGNYFSARPIYIVPLIVFLSFINIYSHTIFLLIYYVILSYLLICFAFLASKFIKSVPNDYSYSTYLWAFPIQQMLVFFLPGIGVIQLSLLSLGVVAVFAHLTWIYVENPMISLSKKLQIKMSLRFAMNRAA